jgi:SP family arabinose:H+ symporter-like MFS transporter
MDVETKYNMKFIWSICLVAAMGGLLFGYDWVVINGAKPFFEKYFNLTTPSQIGWAMSCALVGCLIGSVVSGISSDKFGRKRLLILSAFIFVFSAIGTGLADTFSAFVVFRILGGVAIGLASNLSPMYIAEAAPAKVRGQFVSVNQLTIVIGILAAPFVNWLIAEPVPEASTAAEILNSWNGQYAWRWMFGAAAIPALVFFILMFIVPESPRWLIKNGKDKQAQGVLEKIGGAAYAADAVQQVKDTLANEIERVNFKDLLEPKMMKILAIGIFLAVFQQWCGINTVIYYADEIFTAAGYGVSDILFNIVIMGSVFVVFTFVAIYTVDRFGRKILMLVGAAGLAITYILIGICYYTHSIGFHVLLLVVTAIACYAFSLAPVVWVLLAEIFPNRIRGAAMSVGVFALWTGCFTLTYTFPALNTSLGTAKTFWIYAAICAVGFWVVKIFVPETKGKTLEQIEKELVD